MSIFVCFSSDGQGWVRWLSCLLIIRFVFLFHLLFKWGVLHRALLVVGWCKVLYSSGFLCVNSHYLILPRLSSLVVLGLGVKTQGSKGSGLDVWGFFTLIIQVGRTITAVWAPRKQGPSNVIQHEAGQLIVKCLLAPEELIATVSLLWKEKFCWKST